jgi:hypothetical protein
LAPGTAPGSINTWRGSIANNDINSHGNQGTLDTAAKGTLEAEFGSSKEEDVIIQILEKGNIIESEVRLDLLASAHLRYNGTSTNTHV